MKQPNDTLYQYQSGVINQNDYDLLETIPDELDKNIVYLIKGSADKQFIVVIKYLDDYWKTYPIGPMSSAIEARNWVNSEISERVRNKAESIIYKNHKIMVSTPFETQLGLTGRPKSTIPLRGVQSRGEVVNLSAVNVNEMQGLIDKYTDPEREKAVEIAGHYFRAMLGGENTEAIVDFSSGCHYCGAPAVKTNIFDVPVCPDCDS